MFGTKGDPAHCWCQWYKIPGSDWRSVGDEALHDRLEAQVAAGVDGPGLLAYDGDTPVGWCAVEPRAEPRPPPPQPHRRRRHARSRLRRPGRLGRSRASSCRGRIGARASVGALAEAAVEYAREHGARLLEGYAVDPAAREKTPAADLFHGTVTMFEQAGFTEVARPKADRAIMQRRLRD